MMSQAVEGMWIRMGGYGWLRGKWVKGKENIIPCQNHRFVVPNWRKIACDLICTIPFVSSSGKQEKLKRYAAINFLSINNVIKKTLQLHVKHNVYNDDN